MSIQHQREERVRTRRWYQCIDTTEKEYWNRFGYFSIDAASGTSMHETTGIGLEMRLSKSHDCCDQPCVIQYISNCSSL